MFSVHCISHVYAHIHRTVCQLPLTFLARLFRPSGRPVGHPLEPPFSSPFEISRLCEVRTSDLYLNPRYQEGPVFRLLGFGN
jgi:hypothetical protein